MWFMLYTVRRSVLTVLECYSLSCLSWPASPGGWLGAGMSSRETEDRQLPSRLCAPSPCQGPLPEQAAPTLTCGGAGKPPEEPRRGKENAVCLCVWSAPWGAGNEGFVVGARAVGRWARFALMTVAFESIGTERLLVRAAGFVSCLCKRGRVQASPTQPESQANGNYRRSVEHVCRVF